MEEDKPPILHSWKNVYLFVVAALLIQIILYYLFTIYFA